MLARTGGEELVVLGLVERPRRGVAAGRAPPDAPSPPAHTEDGHAVTASIGIALTRPVDGEDAPDALWRLIDRADVAMYEAKQDGRDRVASGAVPQARTPLADESRRSAVPD